MSDYKYTTDGRKVVVIGKLNNTEYIVQEIFVSQGQEMPGGENFVVKGLLDAPAKSWKQKECEIWATEYDRLSASLEAIRNTERFESQFTREVARRLASYTDIDAINQLLAFLNNEIEYVVEGTKIHTFHARISQKSDYGRWENLKLLTLFGDSRCGLQWQINRYSDGSGWNTTEVYPATSLDDAKHYLEEKIKAKVKVNDADIKAMEQYDLKYPSKRQLREYQQAITKTKKDAILATEKKLTALKKELNQ